MTSHRLSSAEEWEVIKTIYDVEAEQIHPAYANCPVDRNVMKQYIKQSMYIVRAPDFQVIIDDLLHKLDAGLKVYSDFENILNILMDEFPL